MTVKAMKSGALEFLTKPFQDQDLLDAIASFGSWTVWRAKSRVTLPELRKRYEALTVRERSHGTRSVGHAQ